MQTALENLSKKDLLAMVSDRDRALSEQQRIVDSLTRDSTHKDEKIVSLSQERDYLKTPVEMLRRMQFGQKRERFEAAPRPHFRLNLSSKK